MNYETYKRILAHVDDYLEVDPQTLEASDRAGYLADLRTLLELRVEDLELSPPTNGAGKGVTPEKSAILPNTDNIIPLRIVDDVPLVPKERQLLDKRKVVYETLLETHWNGSEAARPLGMSIKTVTWMVKRYWPEHCAFAKREGHKNDALRALVETGWRPQQAAIALGTSESTVWRLIKKYHWEGLREKAKAGCGAPSWGTFSAHATLQGEPQS